MKESFYYPKDFFVSAFFLSIAIHGLLLGASGWMSSMPQASVMEAPSSLEITVINRPVVTVMEEEIVTEEIIRLRRRPRTSVREGKRKKRSPATPDSASTVAKTDEPGEAKREVSRRETKQFSEDGSYAGTTGFSRKASLASQESRGAISKAKPLTHVNPAPPYPRVARQRGWEGVVRLKVFVEKDGIPSQVDIQESSGYGTLDKAALRAVETWKFSPAQSGSIRFSSRITIPIQFTLIKE